MKIGPSNLILEPTKVVQEKGFEPSTFWPQTRRSTKLSYSYLSLFAIYNSIPGIVILFGIYLTK